MSSSFKSRDFLDPNPIFVYDKEGLRRELYDFFLSGSKLLAKTLLILYFSSLGLVFEFISVYISFASGIIIYFFRCENALSWGKDTELCLSLVNLLSWYIFCRILLV